MTTIWLLVGAVSAVGVGYDAHRLGIRYGGPSGSDGSWGLPGWVALSLLMPLIAVPVYVWRRRRWLPGAPLASRPGSPAA